MILIISLIILLTIILIIILVTIFMKQKVITLIIILVIKWILVFPWFFFAVWPGGRRCANCRDVHFFERYCDESIFTWKTFKTTMEKKNKKNKRFRPMGKVWGEAWQGTWVWTFCFFWFFHVFLQFGQNLENTKTKKTKSSDPWARSGLSTHKPKNQKNKKPRNQKTKKTKKQKNKKNKIAHPKGRGSDAECWVLSFCFFVFFFVFLFFWFFGLCVNSHCKCAKQRLPGTVSGCTRSKVDTLQYSNVCYDIVHSANEQQRGMEFNFVRLRHMLLDLCTGNAAICALPQWPVLYNIPFFYNNSNDKSCFN